ncbi:hypothetical protein [Crocosphaera chwakensis]|uniref:Uncharacterized protein n=1 Tax=Crocosphaera chwakensis CCY0110 TaxID=391612 RepID=A3J004_9CHRO|nr:hypothetical protein [Crocosphaera chwakensis]EAZ87942.1 hypothetical protein CY0110_00915 [Crocosphaera chwakensis CCY0110]
MSDLENIKVKKGQRVTITYENREFDVIVIDPDGLGKDQPSLGFGFGIAEKYTGLPQSTISRWFQGDANNDQNLLKLPSGNTFKVMQISGLDNNIYQVAEVSDWVAIVGDVLKKPGKISKGTKDKLIDFLTWFATKGLYAEAYVALKGVYTKRDSRSVSKWMMARLEGKIKRNKYTDFLKEQGCEGYDYANWTNYIYERLFGKTAREMKQYWEVVEGTKIIARNYISEEEGLRAVAYCENQVVELFVDDLGDAHDHALFFASKKFADVLKKLK